MSLSAVWILPLAAGGLGAAGLAVAAAVLRRDVADLQRSLRPLRLPSDRSRRH